MWQRTILFILIYTALASQAVAQGLFQVHGVITRRLSTERVAGVLIKNLRTGDINSSDNIGLFAVSASISDTILFTKAGFTSQKVAITSTGDLPVYMQPIVALDEVIVKGQTKKQEINSIIRDYRSKGIYYDGKPPLSAFSPFGGSPITAVYELLSRDAKNERRFKAFSKGEQEHAEVFKRYNLVFVKRVINAPDSVAERFMRYYTPSAQDIKQWNDYELITHVKKAFDYYSASKDKKRLENLNTPAFLPARKDSL